MAEVWLRRKITITIEPWTEVMIDEAHSSDSPRNKYYLVSLFTPETQEVPKQESKDLSEAMDVAVTIAKTCIKEAVPE